MFFSFSLWMPVLVLAGIDFWFFRAIRRSFPSFFLRSRPWFGIAYWILTGGFIILLTAMIATRSEIRSVMMLSLAYKAFGVFLMIYFPKIIFLLTWLIDQVRFGLGHLLLFVKKRKDAEYRILQQGVPITGWFPRMGLGLGLVFFLLFLFGMTIGKHNYKVEYLQIPIRNLPASFEGFKMVQISDLHLGTMYGQEKRLEQAMELIRKENPDVVLFTGDMVNNFSGEMESFIPILAGLEAPFGKFGILGNHDYGDYSQWFTEEEKKQDHEKTILGMEQMGFKMLLNSHVVLRSGNDSLALVGVENWGKPPFPRYGNLPVAMEGISPDMVSILLSHDPSHWEAEVAGKAPVALTISGHTHGFQFGLKLGNWQWSPVSAFYPRWAGRYQQGEQFLYINRGLGTIGYPGRVGMWPEITVLQLKKAE